MGGHIPALALSFMLAQVEAERRMVEGKVKVLERRADAIVQGLQGAQGAWWGTGSVVPTTHKALGSLARAHAHRLVANHASV